MKTIFLIKDVGAIPKVLASWLREQTKKIPADSEDSRLLEKRESNSIFLDKKLLTPEPIFVGKESDVEIYGVLSKGDIQKHEDYVSFSMGGIISKIYIDDEGRKHSVGELIRRNNQEYVVQIDFWPKRGGSWVEGKCAHDAFEEFVLRIEEEIINSFGGTSTEKDNRESETESNRVEKPYVPTRPTDLHRWKVIWKWIKGTWNSNPNLTSTENWLRKMHPKYSCGIDTLRKITIAGEAGMLD